MAKRRKSKLDFFAEPEEELDEPELIRRGFPELTRCIVCKRLGDTDRTDVRNGKGEVLLSVWMHDYCAEYGHEVEPRLKEPYKLEYEWDRPPQYRPTKVYPQFTPVKKFPRQFHNERPRRG